MKKSYSVITVLYSVIMLVVFAITVNIISETNAKNSDTDVGQEVHTEYIYVNIFDENTNAVIIGDTEEQDVYIIREHMGKIGIFAEDGTLINVLEIYVETLPEADKRLLGEGFEIIGQKQLNSIIEDYTG